MDSGAEEVGRGDERFEFTHVEGVEVAFAQGSLVTGDYEVIKEFIAKTR